MQKKKGNLRRLYAYAIPYLPWFVLALSLILVSTMTSLIQPVLVQRLIDGEITNLAGPGLSEAATQANISGITNTVLLYLAMIITTFVATYSATYTLNWVGQRILRGIRQDLYTHIVHLPMKFFDENAIGSTVTRVTNDTETLNEMFTTVLSNIFNNIFSLTGIILIMYSLDAGLANLVVILTPFIVLISVVFRRAIRKVYEKQRRILSNINAKLSENISGMSIIQQFRKQQSIYNEFNEENSRFLRVGRREVKYFSIYRPAIEIVRTLGICLLIWFGGHGYLQGLLTFGVLYAFVDYIQRFYQPILNLAETFNVIQSAMTSTRRIFRLMDEVEEENLGGIRIPQGGLTGKIEFDQVWFTYDDPASNDVEWILKDVSFTIEAGQFVAFVGATGAGKTTIMSLISRFYKVTKGQILVDGVNIEEYDIHDLRREVGVVQQDVFMFTGDIMGNISLGRENVSKQDAIEAAKKVNVDQFIQRLKKGYHHEVTERGSTLSAGQRQLLSFARTISSEPSVLILDEATANIDTETEELIQDAIIKMTKNRTTLAVAHRISTIADADNIIVMHHGRLAEQGNRDELIAKDGLFRVLYDLQYKSPAESGIN